MSDIDDIITGGGFYENIPRMLPDGVRAVVKKDSYEVPAIFKLMQKTGDIEEQMMYNTYNMGIGMVVAVDPADVEKTMAAMKEAGDTPYIIGQIEAILPKRRYRLRQSILQALSFLHWQFRGRHSDR